MASGIFFQDSLHSIAGKFWGDNLDLNFSIGLFKVKQEYISNHITSRFNFLWLTCKLLVLNKINAYRLEKVNVGHPVSITIPTNLL